MPRMYLPPDTPDDLVLTLPPRAPQTLQARRHRLAQRLLRAWLRWLDRRAGWVPGPDGRLRPPTQRVPPQYLLALGQRHLLILPPRKGGLARRVWAALLDRE